MARLLTDQKTDTDECGTYKDMSNKGGDIIMQVITSSLGLGLSGKILNNHHGEGVGKWECHIDLGVNQHPMMGRWTSIYNHVSSFIIIYHQLSNSRNSRVLSHLMPFIDPFINHFHVTRGEYKGRIGRSRRCCQKKVQFQLGMHSINQYIYILYI